MFSVVKHTLLTPGYLLVFGVVLLTSPIFILMALTYSSSYSNFKAELKEAWDWLDLPPWKQMGGRGE